jgi:SulP family sulfate permease
MQFGQFLPIAQWLPSYKKENLQGDLIAGLTVGVMLIPQGMAYAMIAGLPPIFGLYASTIPLILYAVFGTSRQLAVGPVAMVSLLTAAGIGAITSDPSTYILLAVSLALMVGVIQFGLGVFRLGFLVNFLSHPVVSGFTSAAALIIGLSQLKHLMGVDLPKSHHVHEILLSAIANAGQTNLAALGIGIGGIVLIKMSKKIHANLPGPLVAVVVGILAVWGFSMTDMGVKIVGEVPGGLPAFGVPSVAFSSIQSLLPVALTIALVSFMESIAVAKAIQARHKNYQVDANQELVALGLANIGGAFFKSYPVTGGFSRTAVNDQAGAKTGLASIISAGLIVLTLLFLTPLFHFLPKAILASVIMVAVFGLIDTKEAIHLWKTDRTDFWMLLVTFVATLGLGIEQGIGLGVVLSLAMVIYRTTRPHAARLGKVPGSSFYRNVERFDGLEDRPDLLVIRFDARLYFANLSHFRKLLDEWVMEKGQRLKAVIVNAESISSVDSSALHMLHDLTKDLRHQGVELYFSSVIGPVRDAMARAHLVEEIGEEHFQMSIEDAVAVIDGKSGAENSTEPLSSYTLQTND